MKFLLIFLSVYYLISFCNAQKQHAGGKGDSDAPVYGNDWTVSKHHKKEQQFSASLNAVCSQTSAPLSITEILDKAASRAGQEALNVIESWRDNQNASLQKVIDTRFSQESITQYGTSLVPWAIPLIFALLIVLPVCLISAIIMCCPCRCRKPKEIRPVTTAASLCVSITFIVVSVGFITFGILAWYWNSNLNTGMQKSTCGVYQFAYDVSFGDSDGTFMGADGARMLMDETISHLDENQSGSVASKINGALKDLTYIKLKLANLAISVRRIVDVLKVNDVVMGHHCALCKLASDAGPLEETSNMIIDARGKLIEFETEINTVRNTLINDSRDRLSEPQETVERLTGEVMKITSQLFEQAPGIQKMENSRFISFLVVSWLTFAMVLVGAAVLLYGGCSKKSYPSSWPFGLSACCMISVAFVTMFLGGLLLLVAIPVSDGCAYTQNTLLTHNGLQAFNLDPTIVDVVNTCLTPQGDGDLGTVLKINGTIDQVVRALDEAHKSASEKAELNVPIEKIDELVELMESNKGLYFADLYRAGLQLSNTTTTAAFLQIMGSNVQPTNTTIPYTNEESIGLLDYEALVDPFYFQSLYPNTTKDTRYVINAVQPDENDINALSNPDLQTAIRLAKMKEELLTGEKFLVYGFVRASADSINGTIEFLPSNLTNFEEHIGNMIVHLKERIHTVLADVSAVQNKVLYDVWGEIREIFAGLGKRLDDNLNCSVMYARSQQAIVPLCGEVVTSMTLVTMAWVFLAMFYIIGFSVLYFAWRVHANNLYYLRHNKNPTVPAPPVIMLATAPPATDIAYI
eukprot:Platyproteum_vivax@DN3667_c0_g1_i1.p1